MEYVKGNNLVIISVGLVFIYLAYKSTSNQVVVKTQTAPVSILKDNKDSKDVKKEDVKKKVKEEDEVPIVKKKVKEEDEVPIVKKKVKEETTKSPKNDIPYVSSKKSSGD